MNFDLTRFLIFFPIILISIAIHEFAHCWINYRLGDDTPRMAGRVTLNPLAHLDTFGTIMIVVSSFIGIGFGWGKPAPFNPANFRHPERDRMIGAAAGPISNVLQMLAWASLGLLLQPLAENQPIILLVCFYGVIINASLALFNMLPIYPLDGHHVLGYLVPALRPVIDNPIWGLVFLFLVFNRSLLSNILMPAMRAMVNVCFLAVGWPNPEWLQ
jgi:Zn-dependent protease